MDLDAKIRNAINVYIDSFGKKDVDAIMELFTDNAWIEDPIGTPRKETAESIREFYTSSVAMDISLSLESEPRVVGNEAAFAFCATVNLGEDELKISPIDVMTFDDEGRITSMRAFFSEANQVILKKQS